MVALIVAAAFAALPADLGAYTTWYKADQGKVRAPKLVQVDALPDPPQYLPDGAGARLLKLGLRTSEDGMVAPSKGAAWDGKKVEHSVGAADSMAALLATARGHADQRWKLSKRFSGPAPSIDEGLVRAMLVDGTAWYELTRYIVLFAPKDATLAQKWGTFGNELSHDARGRLWLSRYDALRSVVGLAGLAVRCNWDIQAMSQEKDPSVDAWTALLDHPPTTTASLFDPALAGPPVEVALSGADLVGTDRVGELATAWAVEIPDRVPYLMQSWSNDAAAGLVGDRWVDLKKADGSVGSAWITMWNDPDERLQFAVAWRHAQAGGDTLRWVGTRAAVTTWGLSEAEEAAFVERVRSATFTRDGAAWAP